VDQDACRGWRMCVTGCPYKKVFFNHNTGKAEKCTMCYPRIEAGQPTICSETCVGRLRYLGLFLYDADRVAEAASTPNEKDLYEAQLDIILDPHDPEVQAQAERDGIPADWMEAARRSPVYKLAKDFRVALPLHPEYRTMPMVWYIPPLSPVVDALRETGHDAEDAENLFGALRSLRIPVEYLAELFTAGDTTPVMRSLNTLSAMRAYMRDQNVGNPLQPEIPQRVGLTETEMLELYRLLAIAKYEDRYVIPSAHAEVGKELEDLACSLDNIGGPGQFPEGARGGGTATAVAPPRPIAAESFHALKGQSHLRTDPTAKTSADINLPHWDGKGVPLGMPMIRKSDD
jgi:nitrate reductase beta subunit